MKASFLPFLLIATGVWALSLPAVGLLAPAAQRASLLAGCATAGVTGGLSFGLLAYSAGRPFQVLLSSLLGGFLLRMLLVIGALVWAIRLGCQPGWFCASFFALYWIFFVLEYLALQRSRRLGSGPPALVQPRVLS